MSSVDQAITQPSSVEQDPVYLKMIAQERGTLSVGKWTLGVGIGLTLVSLIVMSVLIAFLLWLWVGSSGLGVSGWFFVLLVITAGLTFLIERKSRGQRWADSSNTGPLFHPLIDKLLIGPRMIIGGYQRTNESPVAQSEAFTRRCALFIYELADFREAMPVAKLAKPGETPEQLDRVLDHLNHRDWVGHSSDRLRVWLSSQAKNDLIRWNLLIPE